MCYQMLTLESRASIVGDGERPFAALTYGSPGLGHQGTRKRTSRRVREGEVISVEL